MAYRTISSKIILVLAFVISSHALFVSAEDQTQEFFPFVAEVTSDRVNVRAGQSANFEKVNVLEKGTEIVVLDRKFSWYKVQLPENSQTYISAKYVQRLGSLYGLVNADRVNVRAGGEISYSILGQLNKGDKIKIIEKKEDWYKIEPVDETYGWVSDKYLKFKSKNVGRFSVEKTEEEISEEPEKLQAALKSEQKNKAGGKRIVVNGNLKSKKNVRGSVESYQLIIDGKPSYNLMGDHIIFGAFEPFRVHVEGFVNDLNGEDNLPIINVSKIKILL